MWYPAIAGSIRMNKLRKKSEKEYRNIFMTFILNFPGPLSDIENNLFE